MAVTEAGAGPAGYELLGLDDLTDPSPDAIFELFEARGWGDGLPLVLPTEQRVERMLAADPGDAEEALSVLPPRNGIATRRIVAVNAVLAGCRPEHFPVITTAVRALGRDELDTKGCQATTGPNAPLLVVHGPAADALGFNSGHGLFGPGNRANATVGRAVRLVLMHVGGARASHGSKSTQGQPSQYTFCIAENAAASPWEAYHRSRGLDAENAITIAFTENPHNSNDHTSEDPVGVLTSVASVVATLGCNHTWAGQSEVFIVLGPEHAATIASAGWSRADVQSYLYEKARLSRGTMRVGGCSGMDSWPPWMFAFDDGQMLPVTQHPDLYRVFVAGGAGKHSAVLPSWGVTTSVTVPLDLP